MKFVNVNALRLYSRIVFSRVNLEGSRLKRFGWRFCARVAAAMCAVALGMALGPAQGLGQRGGGGNGGPVTGGGINSVGRPDGVDEKDDLKSFHHAMEVQATSDQAAAFRKIVERTETARGELGALEKEKETAYAGRAAEVRESLEKVRAETKNFVEGLSPRQKSGLKEAIERVGKAESELAGQEKSLDGRTAGSREEERAERQSLGKALENFRNQQDRLALEMGIVISGGEAAFVVPVLKAWAEIGGQRITVSSSTAVSRASAENGQNVFKLVLTEDLSDLQLNLLEALSAQVDSQPRCGERIELRDATVTASAPWSVVLARLHVERWVCARVMRGETENLVAQGNGSVEVKVTPSVGADGALELKTELGRVSGDTFVTELVRSGAPGTALRGAIASSFAGLIQKADFKAALPPAGASAAKMEGARFEDVAVGSLGAVLNGELRMSDEQAALLASQLREASSAGTKAATPQAAAGAAGAPPQ